MNHFLSTFLVLFFVIDPLGNIPTYLNLVHAVDKRQRRTVTVRELLFALVLMLSFHFMGEGLLNLLSIPQTTVQVSGGVVLFLIALRLIYAMDPPLTGAPGNRLLFPSPPLSSQGLRC